MSSKVECRADHAYPGYPLAFDWQGEWLKVDALLVEKRNPEGYSFQVRNMEHGLFTLTYDIITDEWSVE